MNPTTNEDESTSRTTLLFGFLLIVPLAFLGLGLYRAWIEITFVGSFAELPLHSGAIEGMPFSIRDLFDVTMAVVSLLCAFYAQRIGPFFNKKIVFAASGILLVLSTALAFSTALYPEWATALGVPSAIAGGIGIALLILLWSELYGCLNPLRVTTYYSLSIVAGGLAIYIWRGFMFPWLFVMTAILPLVSLLCVHAGFRKIPADEQPRDKRTKLSAPWKAILLMAAYAFAYGLLESVSYSGFFGPHSAPGAVIAGLVVFFAAALQRKRFDFGVIYRIALPLTVAVLLLIPALNVFGSAASSFCAAAGYTAQSILVMVVIANLCYRYGASAIWLFGIERGVRQIAMMAGRTVSNQAHMLGENGDTILAALCVVAVVTATMIFMSEKGLSSNWGATMEKHDEREATPAERKNELSVRVAEVARNNKLSAREEEVLLLLAQYKTVGIIERELFIANGTAKAHVRHIYQKLDIHTRQELFDMLGVAKPGTDEPRACGNK